MDGVAIFPAQAELHAADPDETLIVCATDCDAALFQQVVKLA